MNKNRLAWFSSMLVEGSISSYVSGLILDKLQKKNEIEVYSNFQGKHAGRYVNNFLTAYQGNCAKAFDLYLYNVEDRKDAGFLRQTLGLNPGIVWFHDFFFTNHGPEPILNSAWEDTVRKFNLRSEPWAERGKEYFKNTVIGEREVALSSIPIFSNARDLDYFNKNIKCKLNLSEESQKKAYLLQHPVASDLFEYNDYPDDFVIGICASTRIEDRVHLIFEAISSIEPSLKIIWFLKDNLLNKARELIEEFALSNVEIISGAGPEHWASVAKRVSIAMHLSFSVFGQPNPYLAISMALSRPSLVTNFGAAESIPNAAAFKIQAGKSEALEIAEVIRLLRRSSLKSFGKLAREYAIEFHHLDIVVDQLQSILDENLFLIRGFHQRWEDFLQEAKESLIVEAQSLINCDLNFDLKSEIQQCYQELNWK